MSGVTAGRGAAREAGNRDQPAQRETPERSPHRGGQRIRFVNAKGASEPEPEPEPEPKTCQTRTHTHTNTQRLIAGGRSEWLFECVFLGGSQADVGESVSDG